MWVGLPFGEGWAWFLHKSFPLLIEIKALPLGGAIRAQNVAGTIPEGKSLCMCCVLFHYPLANSLAMTSRSRITVNPGTGHQLITSPRSSLRCPLAENLQHTQGKTKSAQKAMQSSSVELLASWNMRFSTVMDGSHRDCKSTHGSMTIR